MTSAKNLTKIIINFPITKLNDTDLADKEFKIAVLRKLKESTERQFNETGKQYINKMRNLTKEQKSLKTPQILCWGSIRRQRR